MGKMEMGHLIINFTFRTTFVQESKCCRIWAYQEWLLNKAVQHKKDRFDTVKGSTKFGQTSIVCSRGRVGSKLSKMEFKSASRSGAGNGENGDDVLNMNLRISCLSRRGINESNQILYDFTQISLKEMSSVHYQLECAYCGQRTSWLGKKSFFRTKFWEFILLLSALCRPNHCVDFVSTRF